MVPELKTEMKIGNSLRTFASHGLEILKRSALLVLYEAGTFSTDASYRPLAQKKIHQRFDLGGNNYRLTQGILEFLAQDEYVKHFSGGEWAITEKGRAVITGKS